MPHPEYHHITLLKQLLVFFLYIFFLLDPLVQKNHISYKDLEKWKKEKLYLLCVCTLLGLKAAFGQNLKTL